MDIFAVVVHFILTQPVTFTPVLVHARFDALGLVGEPARVDVSAPTAEAAPVVLAAAMAGLFECGVGTAGYLDVVQFAVLFAGSGVATRIADCLHPVADDVHPAPVSAVVVVVAPVAAAYFPLSSFPLQFPLLTGYKRLWLFCTC